jgi:putative lipase involved disintegration of autophagic bodies
MNAAVSDLLARFPSAKIIVTGSSLGGSLATVAALQLQISTGKVD